MKIVNILLFVIAMDISLLLFLGVSTPGSSLLLMVTGEGGD